MTSTPKSINPGWLIKYPAYPELLCGITSDLTKPFVVELGGTFVLSGWFSYSKMAVRSVQVTADSNSFDSYFIGTHDILKKNEDALAPISNADYMNFVAFIPLEEISTPRQVNLSLQMILENGTQISSDIGILSLIPKTTSIEALNITGVYSTVDHPFIAICMATFNPPLDLFLRQIQSIREQIHRNWICIINDDCSTPEIYDHMCQIIASDGRFYIFRNSKNMGFYHNFEQCLLHVPREAKFIAFADQDDRWYPEKLSMTLSAFQPEHSLVYTDMDIVTADGQLLYNTFWVGRTNNYTNFEKLFFLNTITGAASIFRANLLELLLPFPSTIGKSFHDHWLACVAITAGKIGYIDRSTYAYQQHSSNVVGHVAMTGEDATDQQVDTFAILLRKIKTALGRNTNIYFHDTLRVMLFCKTLILRTAKSGLDTRTRLKLIEHKIDWIIRHTPAYRKCEYENIPFRKRNTV